MEEKEGFVFMPTFLKAIERLPEPEQLAAYRALCHYGINGEWPEEELGLAMIVLDMAKPFVDSSKNRYQTCKENGRKGGNPNFQKGKRNPYYAEKDNPDSPKDNQRDNQRDNPEDNLNINKNKNTNINTNKDRKKNTNTDLPPRLDDDGTEIPGRGTYENVFLSSGEMMGLLKNLPATWRTYVNQLSDRLYTGEYRGRDHYHAVLDLAEADLLARYGPREEVS